MKILLRKLVRFKSIKGRFWHKRRASATVGPQPQRPFCSCLSRKKSTLKRAQPPRFNSHHAPKSHG